ncbi:hypothetical protein BH10ACI1_BH10ACI1_27140 [soil metagenome]
MNTRNTLNIGKTLIFLILFALLTTISGCRDASNWLDPDKNAPNKQLSEVKRDKPNLEEISPNDVDPDTDDLVEEKDANILKSNTVVNNSNVASVTNNNSPNNTETNTDKNNSNVEQNTEVSNNAVTFKSFGKVEIGMTISKASQALGTELVRGEGYENSCYYVIPKQGFKGVSFMVTNGNVARIDIKSNAYATDKGAKIGDTEDKIKSLYRGVSVNPQEYDEKKHDMEVFSEDEQYLIIFETDGNRVTGFRVGKVEEVSYVEGCS